MTLRVMEDPVVPFGHVVLHGEATSQIEEWDLVRAWESAEGVSVNPPKQEESQAEDGDGKKALAVAEVEDAQRVRLRSVPLGRDQLRDTVVRGLTGHLAPLL